ncbi:hypothetical protein M430DRAFT_23320 [Amorphotheca resinae ATCC 22711]|uniref:Protein kinase domain-containing protein n=1 Tax=Amorphotheca resinae ATCC 22711 TaxID=857342 RepID=A0A2T3AQ83_AMORE|nr:hypothetical protein M430DRAFT_23320 [Amorphotheca resinae ATCC 22711]PSS07171.1 hypothetical protein M430DRAFT_23320 [Amorphotheca resinae ATCC 22711]
MESTTKELVGQSGRHYHIERVLQEKEFPNGISPLRVYIASAENQKFVLKNLFAEDINGCMDMYRSLRSCPYLRLSHDIIPEEATLVYHYFTDHLLSLAQKDLPLAVTKRILKDTLRGLAALHDQNIVHTDIKANNIFIDRENDSEEIVIRRVQLGDLEDAAHVPPGSHIIGTQVGNYMWRSPEAHSEAGLGKPSDMFSFGVVCIYAVTKRVIFAVDEEELDNDLEPLSIVIERQISYFAEEDTLAAFLRYLGDNRWRVVFEALRDGFNKENPRKPFSSWKNYAGIDADFKDLISGLTNFDPARRITAHEALEHRWFKDL